jgi:hypothetical protein
MNARREPMLWLIVGIPAATIVGGLFTLWLASRSGQSDAVADDVRHAAQAQVVDLAPDLEAARRRLSAHVAIDARDDTVRVDVVPGNSEDSLRLRFVHGIRAAEDVEVRLVLEDGHWRASLPRLVATDWRLVLEDSQGRWRLVGRLPRDQRETQLLPAVAAP